VSDEAETPEDDDDGWTLIEIESLEEGAAFRFREDEEGNIEVELAVENPEDQERAEWFAQGYLIAYQDLMDHFAHAAMGEMLMAGAEDEDEDGDGDAEKAPANPD